MYFLAIAVAAAFAFAPLASHAALGDPLATSLKSDFFTFFHLAEVARDDAARTVSYRTTSPSFRPLMSVIVTLDSRGRVVVMSLALARSFIDDARNSVFARDIAKSLLLHVAPAATRSETASLANEIEHRDVKGRILRRDSPPTLAAEASDGFKVFAGTLRAGSVIYTGFDLACENLQRDGAEWLLMTATARK